MSYATKNLIAAAVAGLALSGATFAQETSAGVFDAGGALDAANPDVVVTLGLGVGTAPAFPGWDDYDLGATGTFRFDFVRFPNGFTWGSLGSVGYREGFGLYGSAGFIGERNIADYPELAGLDDVDWTLELGIGAGYEARNYRAFGDIRYGFNGHEGFVGTLGADWVTRPTDALTVSLGPRIGFGDNTYSSAYFGVTPANAAGGSLPVFDASGGLVSAGIELKSTYQFNELWGVEGRASWNRLLNDAADSPITQLGSADQYRVSINLIRRISLNF
ncbi:MipA/OmpV family protein [Defluviimonas salinarum]|uniref:MipA/OmpV family protein n=1 Tax=Defluviimonas salinarum TaxID=2992147 RepID=A0ABT3J9U8_9RHOB|nr:MipA/OmpV family protein [Defluviimonas salinarum]MCW3784471.1 MipA/OmpV family protein [Defluviimonas salinarum]